MTLENLSRAILESYGISKNDVISGKIKPSDLADILASVIKSENNGVLFFPDALTDSKSKRLRKAESTKSIGKLIAAAQAHSLKLYKYRQFIPNDKNDSVYAPKTISKAKTLDRKLFGNAPRIMKLERAGVRTGGLHLQGLIALPEGEYPLEHYQSLDYRDIEKGCKDWIAYLSKPADARLERDMHTHKLDNSFELALLGLADWYTQSLKNRRNGIKRNPRTVWNVC